MEDLHWQTQLIHNEPETNGAVSPSMVLSSTFKRDHDQLSYGSGYIYSRLGNPNRSVVEDKLALLEKGHAAFVFATGLAASMAVFHTLGKDSHVILPDDVYFGVKSQLANLYEAWGLSFTLVDLTNLKAVEKAIQANTKLIWVESPSNPQLKITDLVGIANIAQKHNILCCADNTWPTPYHTQPLTLGFDIVVHSTTKYLAGHSDHLGGVVVIKANEALETKLGQIRNIGGGVMAPFDCWLLNRSLATFHVRMPLHSQNAQKMAEFLHSHEKIERVMYPGLGSDPGHLVAAQQMNNGFGGMLSIIVKGGRENALKICKNLKLFSHATSLGGVESLIEHRKSVEGPDSATPEGLLRVSVGLEDFEDLKTDFAQALALL